MKKTYFATLKILNLFIKSFVNIFVDIALTILIIHLIHFYLMKHYLVCHQNLCILQI